MKILSLIHKEAKILNEIFASLTFRLPLSHILFFLVLLSRVGPSQ
jgi:hypothetical protein